MPASFRQLAEAGKAARGADVRQGGVGSQAKSPTPMSDEELRGVTSDACRRATYGIGPHVAGDLGLNSGLVYKWSNGERRSPAEAVALITHRSLAEEQQPRENSLAIVTLLADLFLEADELEALAAKKRAETGGRGQTMRLARTGIEGVADDVAAGRISGEDALAIKRENRRIQESSREIDLMLDRALTSWPPAEATR